MEQEDEYARVLKLQQEGQTCPHCGSDWGHFGRCPLLNGGLEVAEIVLSTVV